MDAPSPPGPDIDRGHTLATVWIIGCVSSFILIVLRFYSRYSTRTRAVAADDWIMLATWMCYCAATVFVLLFALNGGVRHVYYLSQKPDHLVWLMKMNTIDQTFITIAVVTGKISIMFNVLRLLDRVSIWRRRILYITMVPTVAIGIIGVIMTWAQCENLEALFDRRLRSATKCWPGEVVSGITQWQGVQHAVEDFVLALIPLTLVYETKLSMKRKMWLYLLLGCGCLAGVCASIKAAYIASAGKRNGDYTWLVYDRQCYGGSEIALIIICGSVPALQPLCERCLGRRLLTSTNKSGTAAYVNHNYVQDWNQLRNPSEYQQKLQRKEEEIEFQTIDSTRSFAVIGHARDDGLDFMETEAREGILVTTTTLRDEGNLLGDSNEIGLAIGSRPSAKAVHGD